MKIRSLTWESSIPKWDSDAREETTELLMDEEAFARFYQSTARPLWAYLSRVSGSATLADDLVQESYLRFLCADAPWGAGEAACRRYLFRIGTNLLRDHWRHPATASLEDIPEGALPATTPHSIERLDSEALLNAALARLRPVERQLLWLAHAEGSSYREISIITGLGIARIRLTLFRSRHKLAHALRRQMLKAGMQT
jgi:RNA polymerase sigma-70 factor (ECF subfamily)